MEMYPLADPGVVAEVEARNFSQYWWLALFSGIVSVLAGFIILASSWTLGQIAIFFGILLLIRGLLQLAAPGYTGSRTWNWVMGLLSIAVGILVLFLPNAGLVVIATIIGFWFFLTGLFDITGSIALRRVYPYWWLSLIAGIIALPLGVLAIYRPTLTAVVLLYAIGLWALVVGITEIATAVEIRRLPRLVMVGPMIEPGMA